MDRRRLATDWRQRCDARKGGGDPAHAKTAAKTATGGASHTGERSAVGGGLLLGSETVGSKLGDA